MVSSPAKTVPQYLASLPADRRAVIREVRRVILERLPPGYEEGMLFGMIGYYIPLSRFPDTYNGQPLCLAGLAAQKQALSLYLMTVYGDATLRRWFEGRWRAAGKKLDMGKSCIRFRQVDDLALDVVGEVIGRVSVERYLERYAASRRGARSGRTRSRTSASAPEKRARRS